MDENNRDDKYMRLIKWGLILMIIAYVAVVIGVTIYQINRGDYNLDDFVLNFFGGLIVVPVFSVLMFIVGGIIALSVQIKERKLKTAKTPRKPNLRWEAFKDKVENALEPAREEDGLPKWKVKLKNTFLYILGVTILASVYVIPCLIVVGVNNCSGPRMNHSEISGDFATFMQVIVVIIVIAFVGLIWYGFYRLLENKKQSKAKRVFDALGLTIIAICIIALILYIFTTHENIGPRINDAHFDRL